MSVGTLLQLITKTVIKFQLRMLHYMIDKFQVAFEHAVNIGVIQDTI